MNTELNDHSLADLVKRLSHDVAELVRKEIKLGKAETAAKARALAAGAALLAVAAVLAVAVLATLTAAAVLVLATTLDAWLAALVVAAAVAVVAAGCGLVGIRMLRRGAPPAPTDTIDAVKEDVAWVKTRASSATR